MRITRDELHHRIEATREAYRRCVLCAKRCGVDRSERRAGACDLGPSAFLYKEYVHYGEEEHLVPSHTIFLTGCNFRCVFCTDDTWIRDTTRGERVVPERLAALIAQRRAEGARNVSFVGGLPDVNLLAILETLAHCPTETHVVWNTNLYDDGPTLDLLSGVVGTWVADLKFGNDACAHALSGARHYTRTLHAALQRVAGDDLVVRHLVMPGHLECCTRPALAFVASELPGAVVNLMTAYWPHAGARSLPGLDRRTPRAERDAAVAMLMDLALPLAMVDGKFLRRR
jgi:putative pyruvate formate lyase activating enzyme